MTNDRDSIQPWRLAASPLASYDAYIAEYYWFFFHSLITDDKFLCTRFDERSNLLDSFVIKKNSPIFSNPKFIERVYQLEDLSFKKWGAALREYGILAETEVNISNNVPAYLYVDFVESVLKLKAPLRLSRCSYNVLMAKSRGFVRKIPSLRTTYT